MATLLQPIAMIFRALTPNDPLLRDYPLPPVAAPDTNAIAQLARTVMARWATQRQAPPPPAATPAPAVTLADLAVALPQQDGETPIDWIKRLRAERDRRNQPQAGPEEPAD